MSRESETIIALGLKPGQLGLVLGPVWAGKTELLDAVAWNAQRPIHYPEAWVMGQTQHESPFMTHAGTEVFKPVTVGDEGLFKVAEDLDLVIVDEGSQWPSYRRFVGEVLALLTAGKRVLVATFDTDTRRKETKAVALLRSMAKVEIHLRSDCAKCGSVGRWTKKIGGDPEVTVGDLGARFEPRCSECWRKA